MFGAIRNIIRPKPRITFRRIWLKAGILFFVLLSAGIMIKERLTPLEPYQSQNQPIVEDVVPFHIEAAGPDVVSYPRDLDFGKGKYASFWIKAPNEDLIVEEIRAHKEGAIDSEIPAAWLRLNSVRVYVREEFLNGEVVFRAFPSLDGTLGEYRELKNEQEEQKLLLNPSESSFIVTPGKDVSVQIYGEFAPEIAPRESSNGIRFCVDEVRGYTASGKPASTRLASPLCFNRLGIK